MMSQLPYMLKTQNVNKKWKGQIIIWLCYSNYFITSCFFLSVTPSYLIWKYSVNEVLHYNINMINIFLS